MLKEYVKLVGDKILIEQDSPESVTNSGLKLPTDPNRNNTKGTVLLTNNNTDGDYSVGDIVCYVKHGGVEVDIRGKRYKVLQTDEVFFKYNDQVIEAKNNYAIIKQNDKVTKTKGNIKFSKGVEKERTSGVILSISPNNSMKLLEQDEVVFSKFSGFFVTIRGEQYLVMDYNEILLTINKHE